MASASHQPHLSSPHWRSAAAGCFCSRNAARRRVGLCVCSLALSLHVQSSRHEWRCQQHQRSFKMSFLRVEKPKFYPALRGSCAAREKIKKSDFSRGDFRISVTGRLTKFFSAQELSSCYEEADPGLRRSAAARHHLEKEGQSSLGSLPSKPVKGHFFSGKIAISGHGDIQTIKTGWEVLP